MRDIDDQLKELPAEMARLEEQISEFEAEFKQKKTVLRYVKAKKHLHFKNLLYSKPTQSDLEAYVNSDPAVLRLEKDLILAEAKSNACQRKYEGMREKLNAVKLQAKIRMQEIATFGGDFTV